MVVQFWLYLRLSWHLPLAVVDWMYLRLSPVPDKCSLRVALKMSLVPDQCSFVIALVSMV